MIEISDSSSLVRRRFWRLFTTSYSMEKERAYQGEQRKGDVPLGGERTLPERERRKTLTREERESSYGGECF